MGISKHHNRHRVPEHEGAEEDWLMSYADMVTLLMAFFLSMLSVSHVDPVLFEQMKKGLRSDIGKDKDVKTPLGEIKHDLDSLLEKERQRGEVTIDLARDGIVLEFSSAAVFDPGKAELGNSARANMDKVALVRSTVHPTASSRAMFASSQAWTSLARYDSSATCGNPAIGRAFGPLSRLVRASPSRGAAASASSPNIS